MNGFLGEEDASLVDIDFDVYGKSAKSNRLEEVEEQWSNWLIEYKSAIV